MKKLLSAFAVLALTSVSAHAAQLILTPASVIGSSGSYQNTATAQPGDFDAGNIFDQQTGDVVDQHAYTSPPVTYWLNGDNGPANAFITVDLGGVYTLSNFQLYNTHNAQYYDRGTGDFSILGSNDPLFGTSIQLVSGTLNSAAVTGSPFDPITGQTFASLSGQSVRYLQFLPTSVASAGNPCCGTNVYGLNELRVFGSAVPEPGTWALMIVGMGLMGGALRRRRPAPRLALA